MVFSGLDGAGKSTQINLLLDDLRAQGQQPRYLWTRGGYTPLFNTLKALLRRFSGGRLVPSSGHSARRTETLARPQTRRWWLWLALLDLIWVYGVQVRWWRWRGKTVVCDRYVWDTLVDFRLNFPQEAVETSWLWRLLLRLTPAPDAAFLLLIPVAESLRRSDLKGEPFRDAPEVLACRLAQYQELARAGHWTVLNGQQPLAELAHAIRRAVFPGAAALQEPGR